jgi:hypothetical protein|tara:strand:- start:51 stop:299 length:249 start_codon:yes stop_codon:yes gene_type:complete
MKNTENYEQLLARFTKRIEQIKGTKTTTPLELEKVNEQLHYLRGCKDTIEYLMTGKLPNDGNHDGMADHKPARHGKDLDALD